MPIFLQSCLIRFRPKSSTERVSTRSYWHIYILRHFILKQLTILRRQLQVANIFLVKLSHVWFKIIPKKVKSKQFIFSILHSAGVANAWTSQLVNPHPLRASWVWYLQDHNPVSTGRDPRHVRIRKLRPRHQQWQANYIWNSIKTVWDKLYLTVYFSRCNSCQTGLVAHDWTEEKLSECLTN